MKLFNTSCAFILGALNFFLISSANAGGCSFPAEKKAEIECLTDDEKCLDAKGKELLHKVEA